MVTVDHGNDMLCSREALPLPIKIPGLSQMRLPIGVDQTLVAFS